MSAQIAPFGCSSWSVMSSVLGPWLGQGASARVDRRTDLNLVMSLLQVNSELAAASLAAAPFATLDIIDTMPGCLETSVPRPHHMLHECPHDVRKF